MDSATWLAYFDEAPAAVRFYLYDQRSVVAERTAREALAYDYDVWVRVMDVVWELIFEHLSKLEFRQKIKGLAGDRKPDEVEREILLRIVLPMADLTAWDVDGRLLELGTPSVILQNAFRISLRPVSYGAAARRIATIAKISVLTEEVARRLRELIISYVKGVRGVEEVLEVLQRNQEAGGLGFTREQSDSYVHEMESFLHSTQVMSEEAYGEWFTQYQREMNALQSSHDQALKMRGSQTPLTEEQEIAAQAIFTPTKTQDVTLSTALAATVSRIQPPLPLNEYLQHRLENVISTRLRDVRNAANAREILVRDNKVGGVGLTATDADRVMTALEATYQETRVQIASEERIKIDNIKSEQQKKIDERRKRESEEHAKWYQDKVRVQDQDAGWEALRALRTAAFTPAGSGGETSRATLDPVRPPARLSGLIEELANFSLADFRRIGTTPEDASKKLIQKFETLKEESFERWTEGIQAWRRSPLQQLYLKLVTESFSTGKPVAQLAEEQRQQGQDVPMPEELGSILSLNNQVQL